MIEPDFPKGALVGILTTQPLNKVLDYKAPEGGCSIGDFVEVPFGPRKVLGVVWCKGQGDWALEKVRAVSQVLDLAPMREELRFFLERAASYTLTPLPQMLRLATRAPGLQGPAMMQKVYRLNAGVEPSRLTDARIAVLEVMEAQHDQALTLSEVAELAGVGASVVKGLVSQGCLRAEETPKDLPYAGLNPDLPSKDLSPDQANAVAALRDGLSTGAYGTTLLKGVTGSGKTEVYLEAVAACLKQGRQALVLLPEIALTSEFLDRVVARFGAKPAQWHSGVTMTERRRCWRMVGEGGAQLVVGARSALMLPYQDLGLIVVDEEHDTSYKQEEGVLYHARDMAVLRASICQAQVVLASATPALESWVNADQGKYKRLDLKSRFGASVLPQMRAIDMRSEEMAQGTWISPALRTAISARLEAKEQSLVFLNRRGYAPVTLCRACGEQVGCPHCDARLVEHRFQNRLICHQCGHNQEVPTVCPNSKCGVEGKMFALGPGVERVAEEAQEVFPEARVAVLSSDLYGSARALKEQIEQIAAGDADIIIGTQLVAKGHNFPLLTLVGVVDADLGLQGSDLRAAERTFQLMRQVAGRAGRAELQGEALLQSFQPEHPVMRAILSGDEEAFWREQAQERAAATMPPYGRLAAVIISDPEPSVAFNIGMALARSSEQLSSIGAVVYGPAPAPIARVRGRHRVRLLVKAPKTAALQIPLSRWVGAIKLPNSARLAVDIDPQNFY